METKDNEQYSASQDKPKQKQPDPQLPGDKNERNIRSGAAEKDQLDRLQPDNEGDKADNKLGSPPDTTVDTGE